ncbi:MAG: hypothetical protein LBT30_06925 [Clostridiales bacterium]|jgi:hypothetical protein|nr:hypothetical protein [Clostridiales bacterium]
MWFNSLHTVEQVLFVISILASVLLIVQFVLLIIGMSDSADAFDGGGDAHFDGDACTGSSGAGGGDAHFDGAGGESFDGHGEGAADIHSNNTSVVEIGGLKVLTIRGIISFFAVGGWAAFGFYGIIGLWSLLVGVATGAAAAFLLALLMKEMMKLEKRGNIVFNKAIGVTGTVYLNIPAKRSGKGKISVIIQERLVECDAMTDGEKIETGAVIKVNGLVDGNTFLVEQI